MLKVEGHATMAFPVLPEVELWKTPRPSVKLVLVVLGMLRVKLALAVTVVVPTLSERELLVSALVVAPCDPLLPLVDTPPLDCEVLEVVPALDSVLTLSRELRWMVDALAVLPAGEPAAVRAVVDAPVDPIEVE